MQKQNITWYLNLYQIVTPQEGIRYIFQILFFFSFQIFFNTDMTLDSMMKLLLNKIYYLNF